MQRSRQRHEYSMGFTVIELLIVVFVVLTLSAIAVPHFMAALDDVRNARAIADIHTIGDDALAYRVINNALPTSLDDIGYGHRKDPWGNPYQYLSFDSARGKGHMRKDRFLVPINTYFDLYSMGPDGKSTSPLTAQQSRDDIIWAEDGAFVGPASEF